MENYKEHFEELNMIDNLNKLYRDKTGGKPRKLRENMNNGLSQDKLQLKCTQLG